MKIVIYRPEICQFYPCARFSDRVIEGASIQRPVSSHIQGGCVVTAPNNVVTDYTYNAAGLRTITREAVALGHQRSTAVAYDGTGMEIATTNSAGLVTSYVYNAAGQQEYSFAVARLDDDSIGEGFKGVPRWAPRWAGSPLGGRGDPGTSR